MIPNLLITFDRHLRIPATPVHPWSPKGPFLFLRLTTHPVLLVQEIMGVLIGSAVIPIALCLMWKKTNKWGAIAGAVLGQWCGLIAWLVFAKVCTCT